MSLQYYDITIGLTSTQKVAAQGRYFYYLNGTTALISGGVTPSAAGNQAIKVQAGTSGNTIILMPGQSYRLPLNEKAPGEWLVTNYKGAEAITGQVMVGEGDFHDSNTQNTVKLDGSFANNVTVLNPATNPVNTSTVQAPMSYTLSFYENGAAAVANGVIQVFSAAQNPNGAIVEKYLLSDQSNSTAGAVIYNLMAKATAPASITDGDVLDSLSTVANTPIDRSVKDRIKVPAGKGLYVVNDVANVNSHVRKTLLMTML